MKVKNLPREFMKKCKAVTAKRPRTVIDHILKYGHITTEELKEKYGYNHPPRAARDVKEQGIPLEMFRVTGSVAVRSERIAWAISRRHGSQSSEAELPSPGSSRRN